VSKSKKSYPAEFREKAVKMITELGYSVSEVAQQLGCSTAAVRRWKESATPLDPVVSQRMELGEDENKRLRKENARLKMENAFNPRLLEPGRASTAYFARDTM
jgi:transposase